MCRTTDACKVEKPPHPALRYASRRPLPQGERGHDLYTDEYASLRRVGLRQTADEPVAFFQDVIDLVGRLDAPARRPAEA